MTLIRNIPYITSEARSKIPLFKKLVEIEEKAVPRR